MVTDYYTSSTKWMSLLIITWLFFISVKTTTLHQKVEKMMVNYHKNDLLHLHSP